MLYYLHGTRYLGEQGLDDTPDARASALSQGLTPVAFDTPPAFHTRWVNTPAKEGENEISIDLTVDEYKEVRLAELDYLSRQFDDALVNPAMFFNSSLGFSVDADIRSQNNLRGLQATGADSVQFMGHDNELHTITQGDIAVLLSEAAKNGSHLYSVRWGCKAAIAAARTIEELDAIKFDFTMLDFGANA